MIIFHHLNFGLFYYVIITTLSLLVGCTQVRIERRVDSNDDKTSVVNRPHQRASGYTVIYYYTPPPVLFRNNQNDHNTSQVASNHNNRNPLVYQSYIPIMDPPDDHHQEEEEENNQPDEELISSLPAGLLLPQKPVRYHGNHAAHYSGNANVMTHNNHNHHHHHHEDQKNATHHRTGRVSRRETPRTWRLRAHYEVPHAEQNQKPAAALPPKTVDGAENEITDEVKTGLEPDFVSTLSSQSVSRGQDAKLDCSVYALGTWFKVMWIYVPTAQMLTVDDHILIHDDRFSILKSSDPGLDTVEYALQIRNVSFTDTGFYACQINTHPPKQQVAHLNVVSSPHFDLATMQNGDSLSVKEHDQVTLQCSARGNPPPRVTWRREDGRPIQVITAAGQQAGKSGSGSGGGKTSGKLTSAITDQYVSPNGDLTFGLITREANGAYYCVADNGIPPAVSRRINLVVNYPPMIRIERQLVHATSGSDAILECSIEANPPPTTHWLDPYGMKLFLSASADADDDVPDGLVYIQKPVPYGSDLSPVVTTVGSRDLSAKYKIEYGRHSTSKLLFRLTLRAADYGDSGMYRCVALNELGETQSPLQLVVVDKHHPPPPPTPDGGGDQLPAIPAPPLQAVDLPKPGIQNAHKDLQGEQSQESPVTGVKKQRRLKAQNNQAVGTTESHVTQTGATEEVAGGEQAVESSSARLVSNYHHVLCILITILTLNL